MNDFLFPLCGLAAIAEVAWTIVVYKYARRNTYSASAFNNVRSLYEAALNRGDESDAALSIIREQLARRIRKIDILEESYVELTVKFNKSIEKQALGAATIADLTDENLKLKQDIAVKTAPVKKRSSKVGE